MTDLKPCHVCGGKPHITATSTIGCFFGMVSCMDEHHTVQVRAEAKTLEEAEALAIEKWNTRHYPPEVQQAVERMKPKKVIRKRIGNNPVHVCPGCGYSWDSVLVHEMRVKPENCPRCGQRLDWSE